MSCTRWTKEVEEPGPQSSTPDAPRSAMLRIPTIKRKLFHRKAQRVAKPAVIELIDLTLSDTEQTPDEHQGQDDSPPIGAAIRSHSKRVLGDGIHLNPPIVQLPKLAQPIIPIRPQNLTQHVPNHHSNPFVILAPKQISSSEQLRNQQYQWTLASRQKPKPRSLVEPMNWSGRSSREQISCLGQAPPIEVRVRSDDGQQITQIMRYGALGKRRQVISGGIQRSGHGWTNFRRHLNDRQVREEFETHPNVHASVQPASHPSFVSVDHLESDDYSNYEKVVIDGSDYPVPMTEDDVNLSNQAKETPLVDGEFMDLSAQEQASEELGTSTFTSAVMGPKSDLKPSFSRIGAYEEVTTSQDPEHKKPNLIDLSALNADVPVTESSLNMLESWSCCPRCKYSFLLATGQRKSLPTGTMDASTSTETTVQKKMANSATQTEELASLKSTGTNTDDDVSSSSYELSGDEKSEKTDVDQELSEANAQDFVARETDTAVTDVHNVIDFALNALEGDSSVTNDLVVPEASVPTQDGPIETVTSLQTLVKQDGVDKESEDLVTKTFKDVVSPEAESVVNEHESMPAFQESDSFVTTVSLIQIDTEDVEIEKELGAEEPEEALELPCDIPVIPGTVRAVGAPESIEEDANTNIEFSVSPVTVDEHHQEKFQFVSCRTSRKRKCDDGVFPVLQRWSSRPRTRVNYVEEENSEDDGNPLEKRKRLSWSAKKTAEEPSTTQKISVLKSRKRRANEEPEVEPNSTLIPDQEGPAPPLEAHKKRGRPPKRVSGQAEVVVEQPAVKPEEEPSMPVLICRSARFDKPAPPPCHFVSLDRPFGDYKPAFMEPRDTDYFGF